MWEQPVEPLGEVVPPESPWAYTFDYLASYYKHSHPYMISSEEGGAPCCLVREPQTQPDDQMPNYVPSANYPCEDQFHMIIRTMQRLLDLRVVLGGHKQSLTHTTRVGDGTRTLNLELQLSGIKTEEEGQ
ncbi:hypothetical protein GYH30_016203 [Glycine max]|nr:hypothetical protein GYH30_016203 [Glycine max]